jgi:tRNA dimethylallyltransferase
MTNEKPRIILVAGPTASGKSALAADLATALGGVVINADAMQVYRGLPVLTAQPNAAAKLHVPHLLYEIIDPAEAFSAGKWLAQTRLAMQAAWDAGQPPILVGGTGMYFQSLLKGLADIPDIPPSLRTELRESFDRDGAAAFVVRLAQHDPAAAATIPQGDRQRLLRALEVVLTTGKTQAAWQEAMTGGLLAEADVFRADIFPIVTMPPRDALYAACDRRFATMLQNGAIEEATAFAARQLSPDLPAYKIIGLREIADYGAGFCTLDEATGMAQQATRNFAKRQVTWFKNQWLSNKIGFVRPAMTIAKFYAPEDLAAILEFCRR